LAEFTRRSRMRRASGAVTAQEREAVRVRFATHTEKISFQEPLQPSVHEKKREKKAQEKRTQSLERPKFTTVQSQQRLQQEPFKHRKNETSKKGSFDERTQKSWSWRNQWKKFEDQAEKDASSKIGGFSKQGKGSRVSFPAKQKFEKNFSQHQQQQTTSSRREEYFFQEQKLLETSSSQSYQSSHQVIQPQRKGSVDEPAEFAVIALSAGGQVERKENPEFQAQVQADNFESQEIVPEYQTNTRTKIKETKKETSQTCREIISHYGGEQRQQQQQQQKQRKQWKNESTVTSIPIYTERQQQRQQEQRQQQQQNQFHHRPVTSKSFKPSTLPNTSFKTSQEHQQPPHRQQQRSNELIPATVTSTALTPSPTLIPTSVSGDEASSVSTQSTAVAVDTKKKRHVSVKEKVSGKRDPHDLVSSPCDQSFLLVIILYVQ